MSKIGREAVELPQGVTVTVDPVPQGGARIKVVGSKGTIERHIPRGVSAEVKDGKVTFSVKGSSKSIMSLFGTMRAITASDVKGVSEGWSKQLELVGTGFRAEVSGK